MTLEKDFVFPVYIHRKILNEINSFCKKSKFEIFGYLAGNILKWKEKMYIVIKDQLFIKGGIQSHKYSTSQIKGTSGIYDKKFKKLKKKNENLRIVGWWHSHPNFGCFLSSTDLHTQQYFFPDSYQVALIIDPIQDVFEFFTIDKDSEEGYKNVSFAVISD